MTIAKREVLENINVFPEHHKSRCARSSPSLPKTNNVLCKEQSEILCIQVTGCLYWGKLSAMLFIIKQTV